MKKNANKKIVLKLFTITSLVFVIFITSILFFQSVFFQKFYTNKKMNTLENNLERFKTFYIGENSNTKIINEIIKFEEDNNAKIVILDKFGEFKYITNYGKETTENYNLRIIKSILYEWTSNPSAYIKMKKSGKTLTYIFDNSEYNIKNIVCFTSINENDDSEVIFAVSSLQPVNEAVKIIKEYYIYIYLAALVLILILSFIYSNMISKPLIKINRVATKMSKLDFSQKCEITSKDEIGNLANTLNFLSENLNSALESLNKSNTKLKKDIQKEKELEEIRKEFIANVSHELKTPISLIIGYAEAIKDGIPEEEERDYYLDVILDESNKMSNLVKDMLELSKLESNNISINMTKFSLNKLIEEIANKYNGIFLEKKIILGMNLFDNLIVLGDRVKIEQVITNFLTNAIRYTKEEKHIWIETNIFKDKAYVRVINEGKNIHETDLEKIWDRFYKVDKAHNREKGGTGLGLAIVKNILLLHNSEFGVKNIENGVEFYFTLQISKEAK